MSLEEIKKEIKHMDKSLSEKDDAFKAAVILLAGSSGEVIKGVPQLAKYTGYPKEFVKKIVGNARKNRIWIKGITYCDWFDEKNGAIAFWLDVGVVLGYLEKVKE